MSKIYSGHIKANDGFSAPAPFDGPPGWTVFKSMQTEIYKVTHNLHLTNPSKQLHIVLQSETLSVEFEIAQSADSFTVVAWKMPQKAPAQTNFTFVAVYY